MPTPSADYQASISGLLMGAGTAYEFGTAGISGLGNPKAKTADVPLDMADGAFGAPDYLDVRTLLLHLEIMEADAGAAFDALATLATAWRPTTADIDLHIQLPGWGHIYYVGRPRSLDDDCTLVRSGLITAIGEFVALDPIAHAA
jgi:hypothetical protein